MKKNSLVCIVLLFLCLIDNFYVSAEVTKPDRGIQFLYDSFPGTCIRKVMCHSWFNHITGWFADSFISKYAISSFIKAYNINLDEIQDPLPSFKSLNSFFIRSLKPEARLIDQSELTLCSPGDGLVLAITNIKQDSDVFIKNARLDLATFLGNAQLATEYDGGTLAIFRITPGDYHRFHMPVDGIVQPAVTIRGKYESVNPFVFEAGIQPLITNERHCIIVDSQYCDKIVIVPVGAMCVGRIVETYTPGNFYPKGYELGYFCFGGSTVVLLFKKNTLLLRPDILINSAQGEETPIKMGENFGTSINSLVEKQEISFQKQ